MSNLCRHHRNLHSKNNLQLYLLVYWEIEHLGWRENIFRERCDAMTRWWWMDSIVSSGHTHTQGRGTFYIYQTSLAQQLEWTSSFQDIFLASRHTGGRPRLREDTHFLFPCPLYLLLLLLLISGSPAITWIFFELLNTRYHHQCSSPSLPSHVKQEEEEKKEEEKTITKKVTDFNYSCC